MSHDVFEKVKRLPPEKQQEVADFVDYLSARYSLATVADETVAEKRSNNMGRLKGEYWMAEDFNDTPEDFKDYL